MLPLHDGIVIIHSPLLTPLARFVGVGLCVFFCYRTTVYHSCPFRRCWGCECFSVTGPL